MAKKKIFTDESLATFVDEIKSYTDDAVSSKANSSHTHSIANITNLQSTLDAKTNQNAFSNIAVSGQTTVAADTTTDTVTFAGSNVTITTDATNDKVTFAVADGSISAKGVVQLTNSTSSTSTTTAATPSSVKSAYDLANTAKTNAATAQTKADSAYTLAESKVDSLSDLGITATAAELNYVDGVTSNIQTQLDGKLSTSGGEMTGALKLPRLSATSTSAYIGSMTTPFQQVYTKSLYVQDGVNESVSYGDFSAKTTGTTSVVGKTQLNVGNSTASGKAGNSQGVINVYGTGAYCHQIQGDATTNRTLTLPDKNGTLVVSDDLSEYAKTSHNHSASNITSGVLPIERGGTGNSYGYVRAGADDGTTIGTLATAEGRKVEASGDYSHAEGNYTNATGSSSHAEGQSSTASGTASHAEGNNTTASGSYSHSEGNYANASAESAHAEGHYTLASSNYQHVQGKYNKEDKNNTYAHIVGNGTGASSSSRSNAHTLDWNGNAWFAGNVYVGGTSQSNATLLSSVSPMTTSEFNALEANGKINANTLYMLTDSVDDEEEVLITVEDIDAICWSTTQPELNVTLTNFSITDDGDGNITINNEGV